MISFFLALGELEPSARSSLAVLLALNHSGVAGHEAVGPEDDVVGGIDLGKSPGYPVGAGACLTIDAAAQDADHDIVLVFARRNDERLPDHGHELGHLEVLTDIGIVYRKLARTFTKEHTSDSALSSAGTDSKISDH